MAALADKEWSRIYAFVWSEYKKGNSSYKDKLEKDPKTAVADIDTALRAIHPNLGLDYTTLFDVPDPGLTDEQLDAVIKGEAVAFLQVRLCC